jgi:hypothetical protein
MKEGKKWPRANKPEPRRRKMDFTSWDPKIVSFVSIVKWCRK